MAHIYYISYLFYIYIFIYFALDTLFRTLIDIIFLCVHVCVCSARLYCVFTSCVFFSAQVHAGAVDVVRYWQELNFLIVYVTARPSIQKHRVTSWLAQHNFPHGIIFFSEGLTADPQSQKLAALHALKVEVRQFISSMLDIKDNFSHH